jgi:hypothetical protein
MKDLGPLYHFLGISVTHTTTGIHLSQHHYFLEILSYAGMRDCHLVLTPIDTKSKLSSTVGSPVSDPSLYRSLVGALQYDVQQVCLHMHDPREPHFCLIKHILGYIKGTLHHSLTLHRFTASPLIPLLPYSDADWAGCPNTRRTTSGYYVYLGDNLISWSSCR